MSDLRIWNNLKILRTRRFEKTITVDWLFYLLNSEIPPFCVNLPANEFLGVICKV